MTAVGGTPVTAVPVLPARSYIAGGWLEPSDVIGELCDPNTGSRRQDQLSTDLASVEQALAAADALHASGQLEAVSVPARVAILHSFADAVDEAQEAIAQQDALATGNPLSTTRLLASFFGARIRAAAQQLADLRDGRRLPADGRTVRLLHRPLGPSLVLAPWNAPTFVAVSKVSAAFAAGGPVLLKPSEWASAGSQVVAALLVDILSAADLPTATFQLVHGGAAVGGALSSDPRVRAVTFTGGVAAGRAVALAAAGHFASTQLELGSNNPVVVLPDADVQATAQSLVQGMTRLNGQWCEAPGKILVPVDQHDQLVDAMVAEADALTIGHCLDPDTQLGPMAYQLHHRRLTEQLDRYRTDGAHIHQAGRMPQLDGWFLPPSFVTGLHADQATTELFGPAVTVHAVRSIDEAITFANRPGGGLDGYVFGGDEDAALAIAARLRAGEVRVNGTHMADLADGSEQTFWDGSGLGGHGPANGVPFYQGRRVIGVDAIQLPI